MDFLSSLSSRNRVQLHCETLFRHLVITLYFLIIDSALANAIAVLPKSTRLTVSIKTWGYRLRNKES